MPTSVYRELPELDGIPAYMLSRLILEARLAPKDVQIASCRLIWSMDYADIGAAVGMDRNAVAERLKKRIIPRMIQVWPWVGGGIPLAK